MINSVNCGLSPNCFLVARYLRTHNSQRKTNVYKELYITELSFVNISMSCQLLHLMQTLNKPDKSDRNWTELIFVKSGKQILKQPLTRSGHYFLTFWYTGELTGLSNFSSLPSLAASSGWTPPLPLWNVPALVFIWRHFKGEDQVYSETWQSSLQIRFSFTIRPITGDAFPEKRNIIDETQKSLSLFSPFSQI